MKSIKSIFLVILSLFILVLPLSAARDTDSFDGNIFPIYAGNGSLVPPQTSLSKALSNKRTSVLVFYLDDSATSKAFAPVVSGVKLLWGSDIDLIPLTIDSIQGNHSDDPTDEAFYWKGKIPQVVIINGDGKVILDEEGQVSIESINEAIVKSTGQKAPEYSITIETFNEYNSEPSKEGYNDPR